MPEHQTQTSRAIQKAWSDASPRKALSVVGFSSCDSTMDRAKGLLRDGAKAGLVVVADRQTAGRGRRGRSFVSPSGGLYITVAIESQLTPDNAYRIGFAAALAAQRAVQRIIGVRLRFEWPNDLVSAKGKVGGLLSELVTQENAAALILIGLGLNTGSNPSEIAPREAKHAASLGEPIDLTARAGLAVQWLIELESAAADCCNAEGWRNVIQSVRDDALPLKGTRVRRRTAGGSTVEGVAEGIADDGSLLVRLTDGRVTAVRDSSWTSR